MSKQFLGQNDPSFVANLDNFSLHNHRDIYHKLGIP
jgi:hypothetical protein